MIITPEQREAWKNIREQLLQPVPMRKMTEQGTINDWIIVERLAQSLDPLFVEPEPKAKKKAE
jgi:hypothetical protein